MMNKRSKEKESRTIKITVAALIAFAFGYYVLNYISSRERPPLNETLGRTFYIISGCAIIAVSLLVIFITLRSHFFPKKKRSGNRHVFLKDTMGKTPRANDKA